MERALEATIREHLRGGRPEEAATAAMRGYGPRVYAFLVARMRSRDRADEVFAQLGEDLWRGLGGFRGEAAFCTWMFRLAKNAAHRFERAPANQAYRHTTPAHLAEAMERARTETAPYLKTAVKDRFAALHGRLTPEERTLLVLRVSRELPWNEIAEILADEPLEGEAVRRASANARQRFATLKRKLRRLAEEDGLLGG